MEIPWYFHGIFGNINGNYMEFPWNSHGISGISMELSVEFPWEMHDRLDRLVCMRRSASLRMRPKIAYYIF